MATTTTSSKLSGSVGERAKNHKKDVINVQIRLNQFIESGQLGSLQTLELNGRGSEAPTVTAIRAFQTQVMAVPPTGKIIDSYDDTFVSLCKPPKEDYVMDVVMDMISDCLSLDSMWEFGIPQDLFDIAVMSLYEHRLHPRLTRYSMMTLVDFRKPRDAKRLWVVDLHDKVTHINTYVAHGKGSGEKLAVPNVFNVGAKVSQVGGFVTTTRDRVLAGQKKEDKEKGIRGPAVRIQGLDETNRDTARRGIIFHGAHYVKKSAGYAGNSWGCFATDWEDNERIVNWITGGSFVYAYAGRDFLPKC